MDFSNTVTLFILRDRLNVNWVFKRPGKNTACTHTHTHTHTHCIQLCGRKPQKINHKLQTKHLVTFDLKAHQWPMQLPAARNG